MELSILIESNKSDIFIHHNAFEKSSVKWRPFCIGLNVLIPFRRRVTDVHKTIYATAMQFFNFVWINDQFACIYFERNHSVFL